MKMAPLLVVAVILAGCDFAKQDTAACLSYGFEEGTNGFAQCRMNISQERIKGFQQAIQSMNQNYQNSIREQNQILENQRRSLYTYKPLLLSPTIKCRTTHYGNSSTTTCN